MTSEECFVFSEDTYFAWAKKEQILDIQEKRWVVF